MAQEDIVSIPKASVQQLISLLNVACKKGAFDLPEAHSVFQVVQEVSKQVEESIKTQAAEQPSSSAN